MSSSDCSNLQSSELPLPSTPCSTRVCLDESTACPRVTGRDQLKPKQADGATCTADIVDDFNKSLKMASGHGDDSGRLHNLTHEQRRRLFKLWSRIIAFLTRPYLETSKKSKFLEHVLACETDATSLARSSSNASTDTVSSVSSARSISVAANPLSEELWYLFATDDPDVLVLRFLRARKWHVENALVMLVECIKWRREFGVRKMLLTGEPYIQKQLWTSGKSFFCGVDLCGRLVVYVIARLHNRSAQTTQQMMDHTVFVMEIARRLLSKGTEKVTLVFDMTDVPFSSMDFGSVQFLIQCFQAFYPESMAQALVVNAPWIFWGFWKMIKPLLDAVVQAKIRFVKNDEIANFIAPEMIPKQFGGSSEFEYCYIEPDAEDAPIELEEEAMARVREEFAALQTQFLDMTCSIASILSEHPPLQSGSSDSLTSRSIRSSLSMSFSTRQTESTSSDDSLSSIARLQLQEATASRDRLKLRLHEVARHIDRHELPRNFYGRIGVLKDDGSVSWEGAKCTRVPRAL